MGCYSLNKGINGACDTSMGGITKVLLTEFNEALFTLNSGATEVESVLSAATFYEFNFRKGTGSMTSTLNVDDANYSNYVGTDLVMSFGKMETAKRVAIQALAQSELAGIVKDANGKYWALGVTEPLTSSAGEGATGQARGDSNHYSVTLHVDEAQYPYEVPATVVAGITPAQ